MFSRNFFKLSSNKIKFFFLYWYFLTFKNLIVKFYWFILATQNCLTLINGLYSDIKLGNKSVSIFTYKWTIGILLSFYQSVKKKSKDLKYIFAFKWNLGTKCIILLFWFHKYFVNIFFKNNWYFKMLGINMGLRQVKVKAKAVIWGWAL